MYHSGDALYVPSRVTVINRFNLMMNGLVLSSIGGRRHSINESFLFQVGIFECYFYPLNISSMKRYDDVYNFLSSY